MSNYLNVEALSNYIGLSKSSIYKKVMRREIPFIKATGSLLFNQEDIDRWLKEYSRPAAGEETIITNILKSRKHG